MLRFKKTIMISFIFVLAKMQTPQKYIWACFLLIIGKITCLTVYTLLYFMKIIILLLKIFKSIYFFLAKATVSLKHNLHCKRLMTFIRSFLTINALHNAHKERYLH